MPGESAVFDLTISAERNEFDFVKALFKHVTKKWTFQLEKAPTTGWMHYQCRVSLFKKKTLKQAIAVFRENDLEGFNISPSSKNSLKGAPFYCMKFDTRVEGPWSDQDFEAPEATLTSRKLDESGLMPWQNEIMLQTAEYDDRKIHCVIDKTGNIGKGALCKWAYVKGFACLVPPFNNMGDLVQFVMCRPPSRLYFIDMPRAMPKKALYDLYAGIETIKDGYLYDKRYKGQFKLIDEPNIVVFTNAAPKKMYLSRDRWRVWTVQDQELVVYKYPVRLENGQLHVGEDPEPTADETDSVDSD